MSRRVIVTSEAKAKIDHQIDYLLQRAALQPAIDLQNRFVDFLHNHLAQFPSTGRMLPDNDMFETWIPGTRLVVWYRFTHQELTIIDIWRASQDRTL